jgi:hypothetical protein
MMSDVEQLAGYLDVPRLLWNVSINGGEFVASTGRSAHEACMVASELWLSENPEGDEPARIQTVEIHQINRISDIVDDMIDAPPRRLFNLGSHELHSGSRSAWLIDCAALDDGDLLVLAGLARELVGPWGPVEGVPRGGIRFATFCQMIADPTSDRLLIVDDVCTTGASLEEHRAGRDAVGVAIFARGPVPEWATALFTYAGA